MHLLKRSIVPLVPTIEIYYVHSHSEVEVAILGRQSSVGSRKFSEWILKHRTSRDKLYIHHT